MTLARRNFDDGPAEQWTHDTRDGGTGWGAPGVVRVELRTMRGVQPASELHRPVGSC